MAKVKITGHASGSGVITVTAPNTSTDRTITLPDSTDTLIGSATTDALTTRINGAGGKKNIIINGAMNVAQRGISSTATGYQTVDRFNAAGSGLDEAFTQSQHALTSSDTEVWAKGFRYSHHITNGNQTGGAGAADRVLIYQLFEGQDITNSGWDYTSASSYVTLSFWVKSSVAQNFYGRLNSTSSSQNYAFETGSLTANTWTKVTKTIPGNSNLVVSNNNTHGFSLEIIAFRGTGSTGSISLNTWAAFNSAIRVPDMTSTWFTTNNATFEITGVQLEVGSVATDFEHRSYGEELALCKRYFYLPAQRDTTHRPICNVVANSSTEIFGIVLFPVEMRAGPSLASTLSGDSRKYRANLGTVNGDGTANPSIGSSTSYSCRLDWANFSGLTADKAGIVTTGYSTGGYIGFDAEL